MGKAPPCFSRCPAYVEWRWKTLPWWQRQRPLAWDDGILRQGDWKDRNTCDSDSATFKRPPGWTILSYSGD